jgi:hypothetical protein
MLLGGAGAMRLRSDAAAIASSILVRASGESSIAWIELSPPSGATPYEATPVGGGGPKALLRRSKFDASII